VQSVILCTLLTSCGIVGEEIPAGTIEDSYNQHVMHLFICMQEHKNGKNDTAAVWTVKGFVAVKGQL
jgi:hypothetical protein